MKEELRRAKLVSGYVRRSGKNDWQISVTSVTRILCCTYKSPGTDRKCIKESAQEWTTGEGCCITGTHKSTSNSSRWRSPDFEKKTFQSNEAWFSSIWWNRSVALWPHVTLATNEVLVNVGQRGNQLMRRVWKLQVFTLGILWNYTQNRKCKRDKLEPMRTTRYFPSPPLYGSRFHIPMHHFQPDGWLLQYSVTPTPISTLQEIWYALHALLDVQSALKDYDSNFPLGSVR